MRNDTIPSNAEDATVAGTSQLILTEPVGILGAGMGGLIGAYVLLQDGFTDITVITRDPSVGGTWAKSRVYPGLHINNVHGEYRFSALEMPPPDDSAETGGHITGLQMCDYMETFYSKFLKDKVKFNFEQEITSVSRNASSIWEVKVVDVQSEEKTVHKFSRIIVATGGCSTPKIPEELSLNAARTAEYHGLVLHSSEFKSRLDDILSLVKPKQSHNDTESGTVLVIGGGKSAMDICAKLANEGRRVIIAFETPDVFLASKTALPAFIRKSRFLAVMSPHVFLKTRLERFLHTTTVGGWIVRFFFRALAESSFSAYSIPKDSPFRGRCNLFWGVRTNDEGRVHDKSFYSLVNAGEIEVIAPARAIGYSNDGKSVCLSDGRIVKAEVTVLATGWRSPWAKIFDDKTVAEIGIGKHRPTIDVKAAMKQWNYTSLTDPPPSHVGNETDYVTSIYRGIVPAKNINRRDFAIIGATFSSNITYSSEVAAHWIASYFRGDCLRLPPTPEEATKEAEVRAAWMRHRFPNMVSWANESYSGTLDFFTWSQAADELLEDMYLPSMRSGGNWLTWPFRVIDMKELATLKEERKKLRVSKARYI